MSIEWYGDTHEEEAMQKRAGKMTVEQARAVLAARGLDTRDAVLSAYVDRVAARWGDAERDAAREQKRGQSYGLILNSLVVFDVDAIDEELHAATRAVLTPDDWDWLRQGG